MLVTEVQYRANAYEHDNKYVFNHSNLYQKYDVELDYPNKVNPRFRTERENAPEFPLEERAAYVKYPEKYAKWREVKFVKEVF